jgi:hypothetical protein
MFSQGSSNHERKTKKTRRVAKPKRTTNSVYKKKYNQFLISLCQDETGTLVDHYVDGELRKQMDTIRSQSCYNNHPFVLQYENIAPHQRFCLHMIVYETRQCMLQWTKRKRVNKNCRLFRIITEALQTYNTIPPNQRYHACFDALSGDTCRCFCGKTMYSSSSGRSNPNNNGSRIHTGFLPPQRRNRVPIHKRKKHIGIMENFNGNGSSSGRMMMPTPSSPPSKKRKTSLLGEPTTTTTTTTITRTRSESMEVELSDQDEEDEYEFGDRHELHQLHAAITDQEIQEVKDHELAADAAVREGVRLRQGNWGDRAEDVEDDDDFIRVVPDSDDDMGEDEESEDYDDIGDEPEHDAGFGP